MKTTICTFTFIILSLSAFSQNISSLEQKDSLFIGMKIEKVLQELAITNADSLRIIDEPPGIIQGIRGQYNKYEFQLITERIPFRDVMKDRNDANAEIINRLRRYRVIGVAWTNGSTCNHEGRILFQYTYNKFGECR